MSAGVPFAKVQGLGNDFLLVDVRAGEAGPSVQTPEAARALCDRHFGVGGDGVLVLAPPTVNGADARMRVLNADGSEAEMCGNGIRCVAKHLVDRDPAFAGRDTVHIETLAGVLACRVFPGPDGRIATVAVAMGRPRLTRAELPMTGPADERTIELPFPDLDVRLTGVSMGNPHVVAFVDESGAALRARAETLGPRLERHALFPQRTNVELARRHEGGIELVVWERGCGITLACGTGACATAVAACLTGRAEVGRELAVTLLGGTLGITVHDGFAGVTMRGPAALVYEGHADLARLLG
jgi:diaminopimelate epimerase